MINDKNMKNRLIFTSLFTIAFLLITVLGVNASVFTGTVSTGVNSGNIGGTVIVAPSANPGSGTYTSMQFVVLSAAGSSGIRYTTTDGTEPACSTGVPYRGIPLPISQTLTVKAIACYPNSVSSLVSVFNYVANSNVTPSDMPSLLNSGVFTATGPNSSASRLTVNQPFTVNVVNGGGTSKVTLAANTNITAVDGSNFNANALTAGTVDATSLSGLGTGAVVGGALQWGIANLGLQFDQPVSLSIYVENSYNDQTLTVQRSTSGSGGWTGEGITAPGTCVVVSGFCNFNATKASYFVSFATPTPSPTPTPTPTPSPSSGGGGGSSGGSSGGGAGVSSGGASQRVDTNNDGKVDILDFNTLMVNWGGGAGNRADFNSDNRVDILDFNLLMVNWSL